MLARRHDRELACWLAARKSFQKVVDIRDWMCYYVSVSEEALAKKGDNEL